MLVVEPLRWALALRPALIALEQVPPVLAYWQIVADLLRAEGYSVWCGVLSAETFGVPQTRRRAILMARQDGVAAEPPPATHQRYVPGERSQGEVSLFGELAPWVSMAQALGWEDGRVGFPRQADEGRPATDDGYRDRDLRDVAGPAPNVTHAARWWTRMRANAQSNAAVRGADEPAPTITGGHDAGDRVWELRNGTQENAATRALDEPAGTLFFGNRLNAVEWVHERPATTVAGDPRLSPPGWRGSPKDYDADGNFIGERSMDNAVRVSLEEAAVLQGFPADYPWQGSRTACFRQVGDAVPPPMARAILSALVNA